MNNKISFTILLLFLFILSNGLNAQQALLSSGGNSTDGNISFSFGQFAFQTFFQENSSVAQGVQHPFEISYVPSLVSVLDTVVKTGEISCFNALQNITVAGDGHLVNIQNNGVTDFIAGSSITFLPGFYAQSGSLVHGYITTGGNFCDGYFIPSIVQNPEEKAIEIEKPIIENESLSPEMQVNLYPNPNHGSFKIDLINFDSKATVQVYNVNGSVFLTATLEQSIQNEINIPNLRNGLYFVRVSSNNKQFVKKIIVNQ